MAARRPASVCAFCQARQLALSRRRTASTKRHLQTAIATIRSEDDSFLSDLTRQAEDGGHSSKEKISSWKLSGSAEELREAARDLDTLWKSRDERTAVLRKLRNPFPERTRVERSPSRNKERFVLPEANAALIPHAVFRQKVKDASSGKPVRQVLRSQLLRCEYPRDVLRIVAVAMMDRTIAKELALLCEPIMRAVYRCRQHASDPECLRCLSAIITRFKYASLFIAPQLLMMALKFAARSRSLPAMQRHLKNFREANLYMSSNSFRSIIAKFSIGHRGLGEIRNGRWKQKELLQVLTGFRDEAHLPLDQQNHLGTFLDRSDWQYLHGWVAALARCKASEAVWHEWLLWKQSDARLRPRMLVFREPGTDKRLTTQSRGDYWFLEQSTYAGDLEKAWKVAEETGIRFSGLKTRIKDKLLESFEYATVWNDTLQDELIAKCDRDLTKIERALGVTWIRQDENEWHHELYMDQEEALEKLGEDAWRLDDDYGYPWETDPIVPEHERSLHEASEGGRVK